MSVDGFVHVTFDSEQTRSGGNEFAGLLDLYFVPDDDRLRIKFSCTSGQCVEPETSIEIWLNDGEEEHSEAWSLEYVMNPAGPTGGPNEWKAVVSKSVPAASEQYRNELEGNGSLSGFEIVIISPLFKRCFTEFEYFLRLYFPYRDSNHDKPREGTLYLEERSSFLRPIRDRIDERISSRTDAQDRLIVTHRFLSLKSLKQIELLIFSGLLGIVFSLFFELILSESTYQRLKPLIVRPETVPSEPFELASNEVDEGGNGTTIGRVNENTRHQNKS